MRPNEDLLASEISEEVQARIDFAVNTRLQVEAVRYVPSMVGGQQYGYQQGLHQRIPIPLGFQVNHCQFQEQGIISQQDILQWNSSKPPDLYPRQVFNPRAYQGMNWTS